MIKALIFYVLIVQFPNGLYAPLVSFEKFKTYSECMKTLDKDVQDFTKDQMPVKIMSGFCTANSRDIA